MARATGTCPHCGHKQELIDYEKIGLDNVHQDDSGKWAVCPKCKKTYGVEI